MGKFKHGLNSAGYRIIRVDGKQVYEHRHIMEEHLGRKLETFEHVHHKNDDKADNRIENLEMISDSKHHMMHTPIQYDIETAKKLKDVGVGYKRLGKIFNRAPQVIREAFIRRGWHNPAPRRFTDKYLLKKIHEITGVEYGTNRPC